MTRLSVDVGAGSLPVLRAGFANIHLFFIAIVLWMMWQSVVHHDADPRLVVSLGVCVCTLIAHRYARVVCAYEVRSDGLAIRTPISTNYYRAAQLIDVRMHERALSGGGVISLRLRGRRRSRIYFIFGLDLDFGTMLWHFNEATEQMLAEGARSLAENVPQN